MSIFCVWCSDVQFIANFEGNRSYKQSRHFGSCTSAFWQVIQLPWFQTTLLFMLGTHSEYFLLQFHDFISNLTPSESTLCPGLIERSSSPPLLKRPERVLCRSTQGRWTLTLTSTMKSSPGSWHSMKLIGLDKNSISSRSTDDFNGAQCKAVCVEAGMIALRRESSLVTHEDFLDGVSLLSHHIPT